MTPSEPFADKASNETALDHQTIDSQNRHLEAFERLEEDFASVSRLVRTYLQNLEQQPIASHNNPGSIAGLFSESAPEAPGDLPSIFQEIETKLIPGLTHWQHPNFFAYYPATSSLPAILSEAIIAAFGTVGLQWSANPAATELECKVMDWLVALMGADDNSPFLHRSGLGGGIIQNTAGESLVTIVTAARFAKLKQLHPHLDSESLHYQDASKLVAYFSDETHFSGIKACRVAGIRHRKIPAKELPNGNLGINAQQISDAMEADRKQGLTPCFVQLNFGSTNTCGYDDLESFNGFREKHDVWLHVDAAYAGPALILPEFKQAADALFRAATSFNFNGSKWLLCGFDSAFLFIRDRNLLTRVFSASDNYMAQTGQESAYNPEFKDWAIPLGRRFRALRIWMVLTYFGASGLRQFLRSGIEYANWFRQQIEASEHFRHTQRTDLGLVCLSLTDEVKNRHLIKSISEALNQEHNVLVYPSLCQGEPFLRIAIGGANTTMAHVKALWNALNEVYAKLITDCET